MLQTLNIIMQLSKLNLSAIELCILNNLSIATVKREIAEARHLGAKISSIREGKEAKYKLENWESCKKRTEKWHELELKRCVV